MAKYLECRKCRSFRWIPGCSSGGQTIRCAHVVGSGGELCPGWWPHAEPFTPKPEAPAVKPLLVDELAKALNGAVGFFDYLREYPADIVPEECPGFDDVMKAAFAALARHQKEVGDA